jgi:LysR family cyn operon transcriptional activator
MLDLQHLETFRIVASLGNFTRAAVVLGVRQSTVTVHIQALERELGTSLLNRCRFSKDTALTDAGRRTIQYAEQLLGMVEEFKTGVARLSDHSPGQPVSSLSNGQEAR